LDKALEEDAKLIEFERSTDQLHPFDLNSKSKTNWKKRFFAQMIGSIVAVRCFLPNDRRPLSSPMFTERLSFEIKSKIHQIIY
jgi:hypothetical protein